MSSVGRSAISRGAIASACRASDWFPRALCRVDDEYTYSRWGAEVLVTGIGEIFGDSRSPDGRLLLRRGGRRVSRAAPAQVGRPQRSVHPGPDGVAGRALVAKGDPLGDHQIPPVSRQRCLSCLGGPETCRLLGIFAWKRAPLGPLCRGAVVAEPRIPPWRPVVLPEPVG